MLHNHCQLLDSKIYLVEEILGAQSNNKNEPNNNNHNNNNYYNDMEYLYSQNIPLNPYLIHKIKDYLPKQLVHHQKHSQRNTSHVNVHLVTPILERIKISNTSPKQ